MNKLVSLKKMGFEISWKLIEMGVFGYDEIPVQLTRWDVLEYLESSLTDISAETDSIIALICEKDNSIKFDRILKKLASEDDSNMAIQKRKWRAYLLKVEMDNISKDCLQGLLALMEFWISMGNPDDCPLTFPKNNGTKAIQEFFSQSSYDFNIEKNHEWLKEEISSIVITERRSH